MGVVARQQMVDDTQRSDPLLFVAAGPGGIERVPCVIEPLLPLQQPPQSCIDPAQFAPRRRVVGHLVFPFSLAAVALTSCAVSPFSQYKPVIGSLKVAVAMAIRKWDFSPFICFVAPTAALLALACVMAR
jgi:hypothetical protein